MSVPFQIIANERIPQGWVIGIGDEGIVINVRGEQMNLSFAEIRQGQASAEPAPPSEALEPWELRELIGKYGNACNLWGILWAEKGSETNPAKRERILRDLEAMAERSAHLARRIHEALGIVDEAPPPAPPVVTITEDMIERGAQAFHADFYGDVHPWEHMSDRWRINLRRQVRASLDAALHGADLAPAPAGARDGQ